MSERTVRILRTAQRERRLLLGDGTQLWDLTDFLERQGQPTGLVDLFESGWFDGGDLEARLPEGHDDPRWRAVDEDLSRVGLPIARAEVGKILALGKNYRAHAQEFGEEVPDEPLFFNKLPETLVASDSLVSVPTWVTGHVDHEVELAVIIGLGGRDIAIEDAAEHVAAYTVANDLTARGLQGEDRERRHPWFRSKNLDGFCPLGPCLVPRDFLDISNLRITCHVNGELRQDASTADLVVDVPHAIAHLSRHLTLNAGDLILMGTPAGVGPLADGDQIVCAIEGIGELSTRIRRESA
ncbi:MAG: fumarylacetoacetate hydrolase family protein [Planctomycetota bacterium]